MIEKNVLALTKSLQALRHIVLVSHKTLSWVHSAICKLLCPIYWQSNCNIFADDVFIYSFGRYIPEIESVLQCALNSLIPSHSANIGLVCKYSNIRCDVNSYPMLRADSRFWLVNNREIWSRISHLTSSGWDIKTKERHWWRHNGDSDRRPLSLPLRYDLVTLCLYGDLGQINVMAGILKLRKRLRMS